MLHPKKMKTSIGKLFLVSSVATITAMTVAPVMAQYPDKPITIVVPFSPGGSTDQIGRLIAQRFTQDLGVSVVVENRPGANGTVGNSHVARSKPDGYTLLIGGTDIAASQFLYKNLPYDPEKAFTPIGIVAEFPFLMLVDKNSGIKTVQEFVKFAKTHPDKLSFSSAGMGNSTHLAGETFKHAAKLNTMVHIPYNGSSQALTAVVSGQVNTVFDTAITAAPLVTGGKANVLAVVAKQRLAMFPDVPTMSELGYKEFDLLSPWSWKGLFAPSNTPQAILGKLQHSLARVLEDPEFQKRMEESASLAVSPQSVASSQKFLADQRKGWSKLIKDANVQAM